MHESVFDCCGMCIRATFARHPLPALLDPRAIPFGDVLLAHDVEGVEPLRKFELSSCCEGLGGE